MEEILEDILKINDPVEGLIVGEKYYLLRSNTGKVDEFEVIEEFFDSYLIEISGEFLNVLKDFELVALINLGIISKYKINEEKE